MINVLQSYLTRNKFSRGGELLKGVKAIVLHWTGSPMQKAKDVFDFFENRKDGRKGYGSAHYIVDLTGDVINCIPESEQAYHAGSDKVDPTSGKIYTDESRKRFGTKPDGNGYCPNSWTIGIEMCVTDAQGQFTDETLQATKELCADLIDRYGLTVDDITTHHNLVGWKDCPRLWTRYPEKFEEFKQSVKDFIGK